jgi:hypothetical protein
MSKHWKLLIVPLLLAVAILGARPDLASAKTRTPRQSPEQLRQTCAEVGGFFYSNALGYGCIDYDSGLQTDCFWIGSCQTACHEQFGCDCWIFGPFVDICVSILVTPPSSTDTRQPEQVPSGEQPESAPAGGERGGSAPMPSPDDEDRNRNQQTP